MLKQRNSIAKSVGPLRRQGVGLDGLKRKTARLRIEMLEKCLPIAFAGRFSVFPDAGANRTDVKSPKRLLHSFFPAAR